MAHKKIILGAFKTPEDAKKFADSYNKSNIEKNDLIMTAKGTIVLIHFKSEGMNVSKSKPKSKCKVYDPTKGRCTHC